MASEMIDTILSIEAGNKEKISAAAEKANEITDQANKKAEENLKSAAESAKEQAKKIIAQAEKEALQIAANAITAGGEAEMEKFRESEKYKKAVAAVIDRALDAT